LAGRVVFSGITSVTTSLLQDHGALAVFLILAIDAVLPVGGELPMLLSDHAARNLAAPRPSAVGPGGALVRTSRPSPVLLGRVTPLVRSFISVTAGVLGTPFPSYVLLSAVGSAVWCFGLAGLGWALGAHWSDVHHFARYMDLAVVLAVAAAALLIGRRLRRAPY
jgi:membrane protein DedA with SNARE-associated domain